MRRGRQAGTNLHAYAYTPIQPYSLWHSGEPVSLGCLCHFSTSILLSSFFFCGLLKRARTEKWTKHEQMYSGENQSVCRMLVCADVLVFWCSGPGDETRVIRERERDREGGGGVRVASNEDSHVLDDDSTFEPNLRADSSTQHADADAAVVHHFQAERERERARIPWCRVQENSFFDANWMLGIGHVPPWVRA